MKTTQYTLYIEICENIIYDGEISKKQYQEYIKQMEYNLFEETAETKAELITADRKDCDTYEVQITHYNVGASHIVLKKFECKPGYMFSK
jgi:hypothetical protein